MDSTYPWPCSGLRRDEEMRLLWLAREHSPRRTPISELIRQAVIRAYGHLEHDQTETEVEIKKAA